MIELRLGDTIQFQYRNYKGEVGQRRAIIQHFMYGQTEWHPEGQWLLTCWDLDKEALGHSL